MQYAVDLINNNINRDVQEVVPGIYIYIYIYIYIAAMRMMENS